MENQSRKDDQETPTQLIPKMGEYSVSSSAFYQQLIMTDKAGAAENGVALNSQLDPFAKDISFEDKPATGVLLTFEQGWYQEGLALGELRKSLCLAPGEVTKLAMVDWHRQTTSQEESSRTESEVVTSDTNDATAASEIQNAVANESRIGAAMSLGNSNQNEKSENSGFLFCGELSSESTNNHMGFSANSSVGSRNIASEAAKSIQRRTAQLSQATRSARATQIREVSETEAQTTSTRVIANYNHAHALTMQYYEVLQIYKVETKVVRADRCVFIPMKPFEFNDVSMSNASDATIELLRRVLRELGATTLDEMVGNFHSKAPDIETSITACEAERKKLEQQICKAETDLAAARDKYNHALAHCTATQNAMLAAPGNQEAVNICLAAQATYTQASNELVAFNKNYEKTYPELSKALMQLNTELATKNMAISDFGRLFGILDQHSLVLNQQMWMRIDDYTWHRILSGLVYPDTPYKGQPIGGLAEPRPVGYFGNYVAFPWDFPHEFTPEAFEGRYTQNSEITSSIALPTEGVFAEAVLGRSNSAEKIDITRFWNWQDSPIPILPPSMQPVETNSRARDVSVPAPLNLTPALAALRKLDIPDTISDEAIMGALQKGVFSDGASLINAAAQSGLGSARHASTGAGRAGKGVVESLNNMQDFVVGLANSEAVKVAGQAIAGGATGGMSSAGGVSSLGGLLNAATSVQNTSSEQNTSGNSGTKTPEASSTSTNP